MRPVTDLHHHSATFLIYRNNWGYLFNDDPSASISSSLPTRLTHLIFVLDVVNLVASILPLVALFQVFDGLSAVSGGILRARGKQVSFSNSLGPGLIEFMFLWQLTGALLNLRYVCCNTMIP